MTFTTSDATTLGTIVEAIFYGAYVVLFILYLVLRNRNHRAIDGPLTLAQILLFVLCTLYIGLDIPGDYFQNVVDAENSDAASKVDLGTSVVFSLIDYLAQMILLYRCWIIWDRRWAVVAVPGFLALVSLGGEFALVGLVSAILSGRDADKFFPRVTPTGIAAFSISLGVNALTTSLIGITPTLLNIRVAMGAAYDKTTEKVSSLQFANSERATTQTTATDSASTSEIHAQRVNVGLNGIGIVGERATGKAV
ncbi:hypothetical protein BD779DRAFT_1676838 [Infundibulicybe gibba]|nr:hypothetical protein BD779DRAFT_1676838 [Infundibulicybe gibba]